MAYGLSNGHVIDDVTWPAAVLWSSTVGYPSDSLASCYCLRLRESMTHSVLTFVNFGCKKTYT